MIIYDSNSKYIFSSSSYTIRIENFNQQSAFCITFLFLVSDEKYFI